MNTIRHLVELYQCWSCKQVEMGALATGTVAYYSHHLSRWANDFGDREPSTIRPIDLMLWADGWHAIQAVQRLFSWALNAGIIAANPVSRVKKPPGGSRSRVLNRREQLRALRGANRRFRDFLVAMRESMGRPQEVRELRWRELITLPSGLMYACKTEFKGRKRRTNQLGKRIIPITPRLRRLIERLARRRAPAAEFVFLNTRRLPWTANAVRIAMTQLRAAADLEDGSEAVVCYTWRHTAATEATLRGVPDRVLADLMGHTTTRTTARYQHLRAEDLVEMFDRFA